MNNIRISYLFLTIIISLLVFASSASARFHPYMSDEVAPAAVCPGQTASGLSVEEEIGVMFCLTNYARSVNDRAPLELSRSLGYAAESKSGDILTCDQFSHEACGHPFTFWDQRFGYLKGCWKAGENIAWGTGTYANVREIFVAWLQSPEHHANILGPYKEIGIAVKVGELEGHAGAAVWTQSFGSHEC
jgi:uncharacterized protein YkwD